MTAMRSPSQAAPCSLTGEDLIAYADGELDDARQTLVEVHLNVCSACHSRLTAFQELGSLLRENTPRNDDPASRAAIRARCLASSGGRRAARQQPGLAVLALLLLLTVVGERAWIERDGTAEVAGPVPESVELPPAEFILQGASRTGGRSRAYATFVVCASPRFPAARAYDAARDAAGQGCVLRRATQCTSPYAPSYARVGLPFQAHAGRPAMTAWAATGCPAGWSLGAGLPPLQAGVAPPLLGQPLARTVALAWVVGYGSARGFGAGI